ncbi:MAG: hypothetical protein ACYDB7_14975, partial [Mycobacteriales bacterium]
ELMAVLGPAGLGALTLLATAALSAVLLRPARRPVLGACALTLAATADLLSGRVTFAAGAAVAIGAVICAERRRLLPATLLALGASWTSPVDGLFVGLVGGVYLFADPERRREGWAIGLAAAAGIAAVVLAFPDPGYEPFTAGAMLPALGTALAIVVLPVGRRVRAGAVLTVVLVLAAYLIPSPVGSNATRLSLLVALPALVASVRLPAPVLLAAAAVLLPYPVHQLVDDLVASTDPAARAGFYAPLAAELARLPVVATARVEVVEPRTHWQTVYLEPGVTLARGWERQLDESLHPYFYSRAPLTAASFRAFLDGAAVAAVAVPSGTPLDFGSTAEAALIQRGLPYLTPVWADAHWTMYLVRDPAPLVSGAGARVVALTDTGVRFTASGPGQVSVRLRWSAYLRVAGGCVRRGPDDDSVVTVPGPGTYWLHARWTLDGLLGRPGC